jgi:hypothetical protein
LYFNKMNFYMLLTVVVQWGTSDFYEFQTNSHFEPLLNEIDKEAYNTIYYCTIDSRSEKIWEYKSESKEKNITHKNCDYDGRPVFVCLRCRSTFSINGVCRFCLENNKKTPLWTSDYGPVSSNELNEAEDNFNDIYNENQPK